MAPQLAPKACHNCRRSRLKCDRSLPTCVKCVKRGQDCQAYGRLLRWEPGIASRGKMAGLTFDGTTGERQKREQSGSETGASNGLSILSVQRSSQVQLCSMTLADPLVQDLGWINRRYLFYYATNVCKDLVLYDNPLRNPFRDLLSMTNDNPMLLHIIVANAALHMSNASRGSICDRGSPASSSSDTSMRSLQSRWSLIREPEPYGDALAAKQRAFTSLRNALMDRLSANTDVTLATILLFTEFELLDSGRDSWKHHISGARQIIEALLGLDRPTTNSDGSLRDTLISTCMVFDIIGSTLTPSERSSMNATTSKHTLSLLQDAEGNHCSSFPAVLLRLVQRGAQLVQSNTMSPPGLAEDNLEEQALELLLRAGSFDPIAWAESLQSRSPEDDHVNREHIAFAHHAAVCIYLSRVLLSVRPEVRVTHNLEALVTDIVYHLSFVRPGDALLTASTWPAFIAGAETHSLARQKWISNRFQELWDVEPWGLFRGGLEVLEGIWQRRAQGLHVEAVESSAPSADSKECNWLLDLRSAGVDWLII